LGIAAGGDHTNNTRVHAVKNTLIYGDLLRWPLGIAALCTISKQADRSRHQQQQTRQQL
jgi:hypothetical protein